MNDILINSIIIFCWIIILTIFQYFHFIILNIIKNFSFIFSIIWNFLFRIWVIIHEFSHLLFWLLFGAKITKIDLFSRTWWSVSYQTKDYIGNMVYSDKIQFFWIKLLLNQIWIFLTSLWPLIVWICLNYFFIRNYLGIKSEIFELNEFIKIFSSDYLKFLVFIWYTVFFIPSFILSWQDISNFFIHKWDNIWATIVASLINTIIFAGFLVLISNFLNIFLSFFLFYLISFLMLLVFFIIFIILEKTINIP